MFWHASVLPSIHLSVHRGGVPISHNALQHFPECHEAGGYPDPPPPPGGYRGPGTPPRGGTEVREHPPPPGGGTEVRVPPRGGGGTEVRVPPPGGGVTRVGQQKQYSLHGGRYASCVHAGGLSCLDWFYHRDNGKLRKFKFWFNLDAQSNFEMFLIFWCIHIYSFCVSFGVKWILWKSNIINYKRTGPTPRH